MLQSPTFPSILYPYPDHTHHQRPMPTHAHPQHDMCPHMTTHAIQIAPMYSTMVTLPIILPITSHPCQPMNNIIAYMPTQNPWAWVWAPNAGLWYVPSHSIRLDKVSYATIFFSDSKHRVDAKLVEVGINIAMFFVILSLQMEHLLVLAKETPLIAGRSYNIDRHTKDHHITLNQHCASL